MTSATGQDSTLFITGANRGLGLEFARQALARGARKVYAGARDPSQVTLPGVIPIALDVNNAGIASVGAPFFTPHERAALAWTESLTLIASTMPRTRIMRP